MSKTVDAIKYSLDTLKVTPKELFSLLESSKGYTGDNYKRWLANEIINIAESEEVGYSQLLAKWFNIIQSIEEDCSNETIKPAFIENILSSLGDNRYTIGFEEDNDFGKSEEIDWESRVDIACETDFINNLPENISSSILNDENISFFAKFNPKAHFKKNADIVQDAKMCGIPLRNFSSVLLYRMCSMVRAMEDSCSNLVFGFITNVNFLYNSENQEIIKYFLSYFNYEGYVVNSKDLYESSYASVDYAVVICKPRNLNSVVQDGFKLSIVTLDADGKIKKGSVKRYSKGSNMFDSLKEEVNHFDLSTSVPVLNSINEISSETRSVSNAYGYLCKGKLDRQSFLSTLPYERTTNIPITKQNLNRVIAYYGVSQSLGDIGMSSDIGDIIDGHQDFKALLCNCVPIFLFDVNSKFCNISDEYTNAFDVTKENGFAQKLIDKSSVYYSFEAKSLMEVCKGFLDYLKKNNIDITGKTFEQIRQEVCDDDLNKAYLDALFRCKEYVSSLYRGM